MADTNQEVRVKGLTWEIASDADYGDPLFAQAWVAAGMKGFYRLERRMDGQFTVWFPLEGTGQMFTAEDEAKAAAQADFDRRILSSIETTPSPEPQASNAGAVEALREVRGHLVVEYYEDGRVASVGHDSAALRKMVAVLDAALSAPELQTGGTPDAMVNGVRHPSRSARSEPPIAPDPVLPSDDAALTEPLVRQSALSTLKLQTVEG